MTQEDKFKHWLEYDYDFGKFKRPLTSAIQYITGLKSLNKKLRLSGNGIYDITDNYELSQLLDTIINMKSRTKDEISHFRAYLKFIEIENQNLNTNLKLFRQTNSLKKQQVEISAINVVREHYISLNYTVTSKEKDNLGWDLEASNSIETYLLEVKGLSGKIVSIELTPNEYQKSKDKKNQYKLCIVTSALTKPKLEIFYFNSNMNCWINHKNERLVTEERTGARMQKK
jgi:hypothetical protein